MYIQTESTPNPDSRKFLPGVTVLADTSRTYHFRNPQEAKLSPLATELFLIDDVTDIFLGTDFITVTKKHRSNWDVILPMVLTVIMEHFVAEKPVIFTDSAQKESSEVNAVDDQSLSPIAKEIKALVDTRVRPAVAQDGGDIIFRGFDAATGIVQLELHGACSGCPSSTITLKNGIENMLKHYIPEVTAVEEFQA